MQLTPDEVRELRHRPLLNLLSLVIKSIGQPMPTFYMQRPDGSVIDMLESNGCAAFVGRVLSACGFVDKVHFDRRFIDEPHGTVQATIRALQQAGWQTFAGNESPKPGDILVWEAQEQADGVHTHIGFYIGGDEAVSTRFEAMTIGRHSPTFDGKRRVEQLLRYPWPGDEYGALTHLNLADGRAA